MNLPFNFSGDFWAGSLLTLITVLLIIGASSAWQTETVKNARTSVRTWPGKAALGLRWLVIGVLWGAVKFVFSIPRRLREAYVWRQITPGDIIKVRVNNTQAFVMNGTTMTPTTIPVDRYTVLERKNDKVMRYVVIKDDQQNRFYLKFEITKNWKHVNS